MVIMKSVSQILYDLAGSPNVENTESTSGRCWLCGYEILVGVPWKKWQGANFTDQNKCSAPESSHVCQACVWACAWSPPPGAPKAEPGKKGKNLRMYSHFYDDRGYLYLNKGDKPKILEWLRGPRAGWWFACVSDTGQKHLVPWSPVNPPGGSPGTGKIYFEQRSLYLGDWSMVDSMIDLLTNGVTKAEINSGEYRSISIVYSKKKIFAFEELFSGYRGGSWFSLALWLSQRDEKKWKELDDRRKSEKKARERSRKNKRSTDRTTARSKTRNNKSRCSSNKTHRANSGSNESISSTKRDSGGMVHNSVSKIEPKRAEQLDLFDFG